MPRPPRLTKRFSKPTLSRLKNGDIDAPSSSDKPVTTRLDHHLVENYPQYNRATLQKYIKDGSVTVNGTVVDKPAAKVFPSDNVLFSPQNLQTSDIQARVEEGLLAPISSPTAATATREDGLARERAPGGRESEVLRPGIIFEDNDVLVLDKPAGMLSMSKGQYNPEPTIENYGLLVHRLDRATSGVIIVTKNEATRSQLQKQFQQRKTKKTYYAIVEGRPDPAHAVIDVPIARNLARPSTFQPDPEGREAITEYEVIDSNDAYSLLKLTPTTGRTHQIRVHLKHIGYPIVGDEVYGKVEHLRDDVNSRAKTPASEFLPGEEVRLVNTQPDRLYLHASSLEITVPGGERKTFTSPLPKEFTDVLKQP